jgi:hypothetical protein
MQYVLVTISFYMVRRQECPIVSEEKAKEIGIFFFWLVMGEHFADVKEALMLNRRDLSEQNTHW